MNIEYPALYYDSDAASLDAQRTHFRLLRLQLIFFLVVSVGAGLGPVVPAQVRHELATGIALILAMALLTMWIARYRRYERVWFGCRAIAESAKSATWLYVVQAPPFNDPNTVSADKAFTDGLREILKTLPDMAPYFTARKSGGSGLTDAMRRIRELDFEERKRLYIAMRLSDQRSWYKNRCSTNRRKASQWFWTTWGLQSVALIWAILQARYGMSAVNAISPLMTLSASLVAWSQSKRYEELAEAYALAAQELDTLDGLASAAGDEEALREAVIQTEEAISREHKMWCVRRHIRARL